MIKQEGDIECPQDQLKNISEGTLPVDTYENQVSRQIKWSQELKIVLYSIYLQDNICPSHNSRINYIDISKEIKIEERMKCDLCQKGNAISITTFQKKLEKYYTKNLEKNNQYQKQSQRMNNLKQLFHNIFLQLQQIANNILNTINCNIQTLDDIWIKNNLQFDDSKQIINIAEELSLYDTDRISKEEKLLEEKLQSGHSQIREQLQNIQDDIHSLQKQILIELNQKEDNVQSRISVQNVEIIQLATEEMVDHKKKKITYELIQNVEAQDPCYAIEYNKDGSIMISGHSNSIKVWRVEKGKLQEQLKVLNKNITDKRVTSLLFSKKNNWFFSGLLNGSVLCWKDMGSNQWDCSPLNITDNNQVNHLFLNQNEDMLISLNSYNQIMIWQVDYEKNTILMKKQLSKHQQQVKYINLNESETILVSCDSQQNILIWERCNQTEWDFDFKYAISNHIYSENKYKVFQFNDAIITFYQPKKGYTHVFQLENIKFLETTELQIDWRSAENKDNKQFPSLYNSLQDMMMKKHKQVVRIANQSIDSKEKLEAEPLSNSIDTCVGLTNDSQYLVIWNKNTKQFQTIKIHYGQVP